MPKKSARIEYVLRDGDDSVPAVDVMFQWLLTQAAMAASDEPRLREAGRKALKGVAADLVAHRYRTAQVRAALVARNMAKAKLPSAGELELLIAEMKTPSGKTVPRDLAVLQIAKRKKVTRNAVIDRLKKKTQAR